MTVKRTNILTEPEVVEGEKKVDLVLRPRTLDEYVGQEDIRKNLKVFLQAARDRGEPLDHVLLSGPPGLGKTTLAYIMAHEMQAQMRMTSGPALERAGDVAAILTNLEPRSFLFVDEIHRMNRVVEETLYPALEEFKIDVILGQGPGARTVRLDLAPFTLVGATTRTGLLSSPLRDRFGIHFRLDFYQEAELCTIVKRAARLLDIALDDEAALEIAHRSRGTPRIANRLLRRVRDFAQVEKAPGISLRIAQSALSSLGVDAKGFDSMDQKILVTIMDQYNGGPVGLETLAAAIGEESETIEEVYEPYLIKAGYLQRTPKGRTATHQTYDHFNRKPKEPPQQTLRLTT